MALDQLTTVPKTLYNSFNECQKLIGNEDWKLVKNASKFASETCQFVCALTVDGRIHAVFVAILGTTIKPVAELLDKVNGMIDGMKQLNAKLLPWSVEEIRNKEDGTEEKIVFWWGVDQAKLQDKGTVDKVLAYVTTNGFAWGTILEGITKADQSGFGKGSNLWGRVNEFSQQNMGWCYLAAGIADFANTVKNWQQKPESRPEFKLSFSLLQDDSLRKVLIGTGKTAKGIFGMQGIQGTPKFALGLVVSALQTYDSLLVKQKAEEASKSKSETQKAE